MEEVIIKWNGPYKFENFHQYEVAYSNGIYAITRVWSNNETLLYLGKTIREFTIRLTEHQKEWLNGVRGQIKVRCGVLEFEQGRNYSKSKLSDVEALLINWHKPLYNTMSMNYYYGRDDLAIINKGRRGLLVAKVSTDDLE
jgi:hypothetical protein